ncbi:LysM domain/BON superfamily protein [Mycobacteroides abscessus subsp. abscessus]|nr:LysM domain/BON superfamily protein [Mycobacteroides abscessus subsp. abscessus]
MRLIRALAALLLLAAILVGGPVVLWSLGADLAPADLTWTTLQNLLLTPDTTGGVFVVIITIIGWIAWALFTLCTLVELINRAAGIRIRLPGLGIGQKLAGGLVAAVLTISTLSTTAAPALADTPPPAATTTTVAPSHTTPTKTQTPTKTTTATNAVHTVKAGDYLWKIAEQHYGDGAKFRDIAKANGIDPYQDLAVGQKLVLPNKPATPSTKSEPTTTALPTTVVVGPTDSLWNYAQSYLGEGERWPEIWELNKDVVDDPDLLLDGWVLKMPGAADKTPAEQQKTSTDKPAEIKTQTTETKTQTATPEPTVASKPTPTPPVQPTVQQTTAETSGTVPQAEATAVDEDGDRGLVGLAALAGVGLLLTAGLITTLNRRRRRQLQRRRRGQVIPVPSEEAQQLETALRQQAAPLTVTQLDLVLRVIGHHSSTTQTLLPRISAVRLAQDRIDILLAEAALEAPGGVEVIADGSVWTIHEDHLDQFIAFQDDVEEQPAPYPALATLGHDDDGANILIDLEAAGALTITADDDDLSNALIRGMALDLSLAPWSDTLNLTLVGDVCPGLETALADPTVTRVASVDDLLESLEARAAEQREVIGDQTAGQKRLDPDTRDAVEPEIILLNQALLPDTAARLAHLITDLPRAAVATITTAPLDQDEATTWRYRLAGDPLVGRLQPHDWRLQPQVITDAHYRSICELLTNSASNITTAAPWWDHNMMPAADDEQLAEITHLPISHQEDEHLTDDEVDREDVVESAEAPAQVEPLGRRRQREPLSLASLVGDIDLRDVHRDDTETETAVTDPSVGQNLEVFEVGGHPDPEPLLEPDQVADIHVIHPTLQVLGPVELTGARGTPAHAPITCLEVMFVILTRARINSTDIGRALNKAAIQSRVSNLRAWLGEAPDGEPYLPMGGRGGYQLHSDVTSDWHTMETLIAGGVNRTSTEHLVKALKLVRGAPFENVTGQFAFTENIRVQIASTVVDIALVLTDRALDANDIRLARWAAAQALLVEPGSEQLLTARIRTEYQAGNMALAQTLIGQVTDNARTLDVDLLEDTIHAIQQVATR